jgi:hypothetical protein
LKIFIYWQLLEVWYFHHTTFDVCEYSDGFARARWACYLARSAAVASGGINHGHKHILSLREDITDRIIWTPAHTSRAFTVFTEQTKIHIDPGHANLYVRLIVKGHTYQRSAGTDPRAARAVFPAVVLVKRQHWSQDAGNVVLSRVSMDDIVRARSDTVATTGTEPFEDQFIHRPGWSQWLRRFATGEAQDAR